MGPEEQGDPRPSENNPEVIDGDRMPLSDLMKPLHDAEKPGVFDFDASLAARAGTLSERHLEELGGRLMGQLEALDPELSDLLFPDSDED
jgi:hypothetical protein